MHIPKICLLKPLQHEDKSPQIVVSDVSMNNNMNQWTKICDLSVDKLSDFDEKQIDVKMIL